MPLPPSPSTAVPAGVPHTLIEDAYALLAGVLFAVIGMVLLKSAGLVTGGVAGIALLVSYLIPLPVGVLFTLINIPFFMFGFITMGARFTCKSLLGSVMIMGLLQVMPHALSIGYVNPAFAAVAGGTLCGMAILAFARHGAGVGGTGIVTLWLQKKYAINAGRSQILIDSAILIVSTTVVAPDRAAWSALSAVAMSGMVMAWHRPGRYAGT